MQRERLWVRAFSIVWVGWAEALGHRLGVKDPVACLAMGTGVRYLCCTSLGCRMWCALQGISCWHEGLLKRPVCMLLLSWILLDVLHWKTILPCIPEHQCPSCSGGLDVGAVLQGTVAVTALGAGQLFPNEDLVAIELHSRPVSLGKWEVGPLTGKPGEMLRRPSLQMSVWFSFSLV